MSRPFFPPPSEASALLCTMQSSLIVWELSVRGCRQSSRLRTAFFGYTSVLQVGLCFWRRFRMRCGQSVNDWGAGGDRLARGVRGVCVSILRLGRAHFNFMICGDLVFQFLGCGRAPISILSFGLVAKWSLVCLCCSGVWGVLCALCAEFLV